MGGGGPTIRAGHGMVGGGGDHYNMVNIKRPDSVITTSSIVSSSDTAPSEAGDSSAESTVGPMVRYINVSTSVLSSGNGHLFLDFFENFESSNLIKFFDIFDVFKKVLAF